MQGIVEARIIPTAIFVSEGGEFCLQRKLDKQGINKWNKGEKDHIIVKFKSGIEIQIDQ
jgi:hypothetical protein